MLVCVFDLQNYLINLIMLLTIKKMQELFVLTIIERRVFYYYKY